MMEQPGTFKHAAEQHVRHRRCPAYGRVRSEALKLGDALMTAAKWRAVILSEFGARLFGGALMP